MKVYVKAENTEQELMFPTMRELQIMYRMKFISPNDLVRRENSDRWVPAKKMPELRISTLENPYAAVLVNIILASIGLMAIVMMVRMMMTQMPKF